MGENHRTEYLEQLKIAIQELKKLKGIMRIDGYLEALKKIRKMTEVFAHIGYNFSAKVEEIHNLQGFYLIRTIKPPKKTTGYL